MPRKARNFQISISNFQTCAPKGTRTPMPIKAMHLKHVCIPIPPSGHYTRVVNQIPPASTRGNDRSSTRGGPSARRLHKPYYSAFFSAGVSSLTSSTTFSAGVSFSSSTFANAASALYFIFRDFALRSRTKYSFD